MHRRDQDYQDALEFKPERYLESKFGTRKEHETETQKARRAVYTFGAGRRRCPGLHLGENSLVRARSLSADLTANLLNFLSGRKLTWQNWSGGSISCPRWIRPPMSPSHSVTLMPMLRLRTPMVSLQVLNHTGAELCLEARNMQKLCRGIMRARLLYSSSTQINTERPRPPPYSWWFNSLHYDNIEQIICQSTKVKGSRDFIIVTFRQVICFAVSWTCTSVSRLPYFFHFD